jgi:hypothetical protein
MKCRVGGKPSESDELRKMLYEAILLLCRTRIGREFLRKNKIYPVTHTRTHTHTHTHTHCITSIHMYMHICMPARTAARGRVPA